MIIVFFILGVITGISGLLYTQRTASQTDPRLQELQTRHTTLQNEWTTLNIRFASLQEEIAARDLEIIDLKTKSEKPRDTNLRIS